MQDGQENISAQSAALDFARRTIPFWQAAFGSELLGVYLIGSLAHGGFSRRYSDIDMAVVTQAGLSPQTLDRVRSEAAAVSVEWAAKLSVFWTDRYFGLGRFPLLDRVDYLDHAVVLTGHVAAWPRQARNKARANRIDDVAEHDWHAAGCLQLRAHGVWRWTIR